MIARITISYLLQLEDKIDLRQNELLLVTNEKL